MPAALMTKLVGLVYKIPLLSVVGVEGMAYFLAAYHVYAVLFVLSSTGLPTALSLQIARARATGDTGSVSRVLGVAMLLFLGIGAVGTLLLWSLAERVSLAIAMPRAALAIKAIAPALFLSTFVGAAKGYFQGHSRMGATALSEVLEALGKLCFGLAFSHLARRAGRDVQEVAAAAIFGITLGLFLSAIVLAILLVQDRWCAARGKTVCVPLPARRTVTAELLRVALPVTVSSSVMSIVSLVDTALISSRLQAAGFAENVAHAMYSSYGNLAIPLYNLVPALLQPITLSLMPLYATATAGGDETRREETWRTAVRIVTLVCVPAALGLSLFAKPLLLLVFGGQETAVDVAAPLLSLLSIAVLPAGLMTLMSTALQATGHERLPVIAAGVGGAVKLLTECLLLTLPPIYLHAAPLSTVFCTVTVLVIEWVALARTLGTPPLSPQDLLRPLGAALPAMLVGVGTYALALRYLPARYAILPVLAAVLVTFFPLALRLGAVGREDLLSLPFGARAVPWLEKLKLLKGSIEDDARRKNAEYSAKTSI